MGHLHTNLNKNDGVEAILITGEQFFDLDKILDIYYKRPESGSVNTTHIFTMSADKPGIMELKDSTDSVVRVQDLRRGNLSDADRVAGLTRALLTIQPMKKPGLKPIKQIELATKWHGGASQADTGKFRLDIKLDATASGCPQFAKWKIQQLEFTLG